MSDEQAYVSRKPCGCVGIVAMEREHEVPKMVAAAIRRGETVDRLTVEQVRATPPRCPEHQTPAAHEVRTAGGLELPGFADVASKPEPGRGYPG